MNHPYSDLPATAFWRTGVAEIHPQEISGLWTPKFHIRPSSKVATFGSCFAQHIGNALRKRGYTWYVEETAPFGMTADSALKLNYDVFSCRTGNIYTTSLLSQWIGWAARDNTPPDEYWMKGDRFLDPFRPNVEPNGFASLDDLFASRNETIRCFRTCIETCDYFVFTLGLTESWRNSKYGFEYPMCPGTVAGQYDPNSHEFFNHDYGTARKALGDALVRMSQINPRARFILTVSPVPLTATASGNHVLVASGGSKAVLRAVAGSMAERRSNVDYFPSYEIVTSHPFRGMAYEPNLRNVNRHGVDFVMNSFFSELHKRFGRPNIIRNDSETQGVEEVCEEVLLDAFAGTN